VKDREPRILVEDLPAEHLAELEFLWMRREAMVRSYDHFAWHLADVERRMEANAIGIEVAARPALPLLEEALGGEEESLAAAAAWALLRIGGERATRAVLAAIESGAPPARAGAREALVFGPAAEVLDRVRMLAGAPDAAVPVTAAEVLAAHGTPVSHNAASALGAWLADADPLVRLAACRVAAWSATGADRLETLARGDSDEAVRAAAFEAGAWQRAPWALALGRERARAIDARNMSQLSGFCAIAELADAPLVAALGAEAALGPARFGLLATYGTAASIEACLAGIAGKDAADAEAAGRAFVRMTGFGLGAARRVALPPPEGAGPDAAEFADEAFVPDPAVAKKYWDEHRKELAGGRRWSRGREVDGVNPSVLDEVDLGARSEALARGRFRGAWSGSRREWLLI
jgi:hypothetical protein